MPFRWNPREHVSLARYFIKWILIASPVGALIGSAVALFLWGLDVATRTRWDHPSLLFWLPLAGVGIGLLYHSLGRSVEGGNNLIVEQIHEPDGGVPGRMAPLVLIGTVVTHLFGGSAGREGTAVQMGGSIASTVCRWLKLPAHDVRTLLMVGVAAGFGAVFGTPLTGAIFAVEVLAIGRMSYDALVPCLIGGIVGDATTTAWGIGHTHYHVASFANLGLVAVVPQISWLLLGKVAIASIAFGLASVLFAELAHSLSRVFKWALPWPVSTGSGVASVCCHSLREIVRHGFPRGHVHHQYHGEFVSRLVSCGHRQPGRVGHDAARNRGWIRRRIHDVLNFHVRIQLTHRRWSANQGYNEPPFIFGECMGRG
ncbi:MAG TPA: chloride channel protein [Tepidisphaeraceae bacterium]|nr:chloride channel protein [Tepidisphaeraceae bacterium]